MDGDSPWRCKHSTEVMEAYHGVMEAHPGTLKANPGATKVHSGVLKADPRTSKAHSKALEVHLGALETHPGAMEAHPGAKAHPGAVDTHLGGADTQPRAVDIEAHPGSLEVHSCSFEPACWSRGGCLALIGLSDTDNLKMWKNLYLSLYKKWISSLVKMNANCKLQRNRSRNVAPSNDGLMLNICIIIKKIFTKSNIVIVIIAL
jgi:hypothetical protein